MRALRGTGHQGASAASGCIATSPPCCGKTICNVGYIEEMGLREEEGSCEDKQEELQQDPQDEQSRQELEELEELQDQLEEMQGALQQQLDELEPEDPQEPEESSAEDQPQEPQDQDGDQEQETQGEGKSTPQPRKETMTRDEAQRLLQAVRDKERLRRLEQIERERAGAPSTGKDW